MPAFLVFWDRGGIPTTSLKLWQRNLEGNSTSIFFLWGPQYKMMTLYDVRITTRFQTVAILDPPSWNSWWPPFLRHMGSSFYIAGFKGNIFDVLFSLLVNFLWESYNFSLKRRKLKILKPLQGEVAMITSNLMDKDLPFIIVSRYILGKSTSLVALAYLKSSERPKSVRAESPHIWV